MKVLLYISTSVCNTLDERVTIEVVNHITFLIVSTCHALRVSYVAHFNATETISFRLAGRKVKCLEIVTTIRRNIFHINCVQRTINVTYPLTHITRHIIYTETIREE